MKIEELTEESLPRELAAHHPLMVLAAVFPGVGDNRGFMAAVSDVAELHQPEVRFFKVDVSENPTALNRLDLYVVPSTVLFEYGSEVARFGGADCVEDLEQALRKRLNWKG